MTLATLARDRRAPRCALAVLVVLVEDRLLSAQWARLKLLQVEHAAGMPRATVSKALRWLVAQGYIQRQHEPFVGALYRLPQE